MADRVVTNYIDDDGIDVGTKLVSKEYLLENYPDLVPWIKTPALWLWGRNNTGQLGDNSIIDKSSPIQTTSAGTNWKSVSSKGLFATGIKTDGTLWTWGYNGSGALGDNTVFNKSSPVQTISGGTNWKSISSTSDAAAAIKTDGTLWMWGYNGRGLLGDSTVTNKSSPVQTAAAGNNWKQVSVSGTRTAAVKTDGTLWVWGWAEAGVLGTNSRTVSHSSPTQTSTGGTNWKQASVGSNMMAAVKTDGTLFTWGSGSFGELGTDTNVARSTPTQTASAGTNWKQVSSGRFSMAAIKTDGTLWTWGRNNYGQLAKNDTLNRSSPTQTVSGGTNWFKVDAEETMLAIKTDGSLWAWGYNYFGSVGNGVAGSTRNVSSPVQTITGGTGWRDISSGIATASALRDEGEY